MKTSYSCSLAAFRIWVQVVDVEQSRCDVALHLDVGRRDSARQFGASEARSCWSVLSCSTNAILADNGTLKGRVAVEFVEKLYHTSQKSELPTTNERDMAATISTRAPSLHLIHRESFEPCEQIAELYFPQQRSVPEPQHRRSHLTEVAAR